MAKVGKIREKQKSSKPVLEGMADTARNMQSIALTKNDKTSWKFYFFLR